MVRAVAVSAGNPGSVCDLLSVGMSAEHRHDHFQQHPQISASSFGKVRSEVSPLRGGAAVSEFDDTIR